MAHDVFISYSSKDKAIADAVCHGLEARGLRCWIAPRDILAGRKFEMEILGAIKDAKAMVLIFSSQTNESTHVANEVGCAFKYGVVVVPFRTEESEPTNELEYYLSSVHWLDAFSPPMESHIGLLAATLSPIVELSCQVSAATLPGVQSSSGGTALSRQAKFETAMEEGDRLLEAGDWGAAEAAFRRGMAVPGFGEAGSAIDGIKAAQAGLAEAKRLAEEQRIVEEQRLAEANQAAEAQRVAEEKRFAEEKRVAEEKRLAEKQRQRQYLAAVAAGEAAFKRQDFEVAARETGAALVLVPDGAKALALKDRLLPTLEVRSLVDGSVVSGALIGFSGKASEYVTPATFTFETGNTYEVSVSPPSADGRWTPVSKTFVADWLGPRVWAASLAVSEPEPPKLCLPADCQAAEWKVSEPFSKSGWAQEIVHAATGIAFRFVPPGAFTMGSPVEEAGRAADEVQHPVTLTQGFYIGKYSVTQAQWERVMGANPSHFKGADLPVSSVLWNDCQMFLKKLGIGARLPTEAEWEYACRAGTASALNSGKAVTASILDRCPNLGEVAWYCENSGKKPHPVGQKSPNAWGLHDMHGNVWEWCQDWYGAYPTSAATNPKGPLIVFNERRVIRGGCWNCNAGNCRSASRNKGNPYYASYDVGFRVVLPLGQQ